MHPLSSPDFPDFETQLADLRGLIAHIDGPIPLPAETPLSDWLAHVRGLRAKFPLHHPRLNIFVGTHGEPEPADTAMHHIVMQNINTPDGPLAGLCQAVDMDLRLYDLSAAPAEMDAEHLVRAMSYGMMAVEPSVDCYAAVVTGPGLNTPIKDISPSASDVIDALLQDGSPAIAALTGFILATALAKKPLLLEGDTALTIVNLLARANPAAIGHVAVLVPTAYQSDMSPPCPTLTVDHDPDVPGFALATIFRTLRS